MRPVRNVLLYGTAGAALLGCLSACAGEPERAGVDKRAVELMDRVEAKMRAAKTIEVVKTSSVREPMTGDANGSRVLKVQVMRPNKYRVEALEMDSMAKQHAYNTFRLSDGTLRLSERFKKGHFDPKTKKYTEFAEKDWTRERRIERTADDDIYVWDDDIQTLAGLYVADDEHPGLGHDWRNHKLTEPTFDSIRYVGKEDWKGKSFDVVEWAYTIGIHPLEQQVRYRQKVYVGQDTLVHRVVTTTSKGAVLEDDYRSIVLNPALPDSLFRIPSEGVEKEIGNYKPRHGVGDVLPDWTLPAAGALGDTITFSKAMAGKKAAVVWFWGYH